MREPAFTQQFLKDVAKHELRILQDSGLYRHLRFRQPGTGCYGFDIVTWPGWLAYSGDMGSFMFTRLDDMLQFFRKEPRNGDLFGGIDLRYWAEKCTAADKCDGITEFDPPAFKREITRQRRELLVKHGRKLSADERADLWEDLGDVKDAAAEDQHEAISAVRNFVFIPCRPNAQHIGLDTSDFPSCKRYTQRFLWCCCALAWAVAKYDGAKVSAGREAANEPIPTVAMVA